MRSPQWWLSCIEHVEDVLDPRNQVYSHSADRFDRAILGRLVIELSRRAEEGDHGCAEHMVGHGLDTRISAHKTHAFAADRRSAILPMSGMMALDSVMI